MRLSVIFMPSYTEHFEKVHSSVPRKHRPFSTLLSAKAWPHALQAIFLLECTATAFFNKAQCRSVSCHLSEITNGVTSLANQMALDLVSSTEPENGFRTCKNSHV